MQPTPSSAPPPKKKITYWVIGTLSAAVIAGCAIGGIALASQGNDRPSAGVVTPTRRPTSTPKPTATPKPLGSATIGGTIASFTAKYGGLGELPNGYIFFLDGRSVNVTLMVSGGRVSEVSVAGQPTWTASQSFQACAPFLPSGVTKFNSAPPFTDFHTSIGEVVEEVGNASCTLTIG